MKRSIFEFFVGEPTNTDRENLTATTNWLTVPNAMTAARPPLALEVSRRLIAGEKGALPLALLMAASDMEGKVGRLLDKVVPEWEVGNSEIGEKIDTYADAAALLLVAPSLLKAPRVPITAKYATARILGQEAEKTAWAIQANNQYRAASGSEENLYIPPTRQAKIAMAEKFSAVVLGVAAHETDSQIERQALGGFAVFYAHQGVDRAETEIAGYKEQFAGIMAQYE